MKCLIKKLVGNNFFDNRGNEMCIPLPPIVASLIGSVFFVTIMTIASHFVR